VTIAVRRLGCALLGFGVLLAFTGHPGAQAKAPRKIFILVDMEVGFKLTIDAEMAAYVPGLTRVDTHTVRGTFADILVITRLMQILTSLS
jgi:D-aminopeptidase